MKNAVRVHYPTCEPCLGHGFQNYKNAGSDDLECGRDGAIAILEPETKAYITKSMRVSINGTDQADLPTHVGFKAFDVRRNLLMIV